MRGKLVQEQEAVACSNRTEGAGRPRAVGQGTQLRPWSSFEKTVLSKLGSYHGLHEASVGMFSILSSFSGCPRGRVA